MWVDHSQNSSSILDADFHFYPALFLATMTASHVRNCFWHAPFGSLNNKPIEALIKALYHTCPDRKSFTFFRGILFISLDKTTDHKIRWKGFSLTWPIHLLFLAHIVIASCHYFLHASLFVGWVADISRQLAINVAFLVRHLHGQTFVCP